VRAFSLLLLATLAASPASAGALTGVCPDGSAFVVSRREDAPCRRPRFVDSAEELPPLRPDYLPRPYGWLVEQEARNPNNPYNMVEAARKLRAGHQAAASGSDSGSDSGTPELDSTEDTAALPAPAPLALDAQELRDLVQVIVLRQELAPATFHVQDVQGREALLIRLARSAAFEELVERRSGRGGRVIAFAARALHESEFHPNFLVVQDGITHRPDPEDGRELGLLAGEPGGLAPGTLVLGYFRLPERFDPARPLTVYWNDRSLDVLLAPEG
jgi:hypothetical protein